MPWVKLDENFPDHPKVARAGPVAAWLYVCGLAYCNRLLTDGFIPAGQLRKLADVDDPTALADRLVSAELWEAAPGGYRVHDFLEYQPSKEHAEAVSAARSEAGRIGGKQKSSKLPDVSLRDAEANGQAKSKPVPVTGTVNQESRDSQEGESLSSPDGDGVSVVSAIGASLEPAEPELAHANGDRPHARAPDWPDMAWIGDGYEQSFWPMYPRKTHKQHGLDAWRRLMKRQPSYEAALALAERILEVVSEQSEHWTNTRFTPEAGAYLNGRRWEDEEIIPTSRPARR